MFRLLIIIYGLLFLAGAALAVLADAAVVLIAYLAINGVVVAGAVLFERRGYRPLLDQAHGEWQQTGERFIDPVSGHLMEVRYNPSTGQRDYVEVQDDAGSLPSASPRK